MTYPDVTYLGSPADGMRLVHARSRAFALGVEVGHANRDKRPAEHLRAKHAEALRELFELESRRAA